MPAPSPSATTAPLPPSPARRRSAALAVVLAAAVLHAGAATAQAGVLRLQSAGDDLDRPATPTLLLPDGGSRTLATVPAGSQGPAPKAFTVSPDRRWIAMTVGTRLVLLPTDGGPATVLRDARLRRGPHVPTWAGVGPASAWWDASGSSLTTGPLRTASGASAVRRCTVAPPTCRSTVLDGALPVSALPDGRLLLTEELRTLEPALRGDYAGWRDRSAAWVRRQRRLLHRPRTTSLRAEGRGGTPARIVWRQRRAATAGIVRFQALVPTGASGALLQWDSTRLRLHTRHRDGRLQARVAVIRGSAGTWNVTPGARLRVMPRSVTGRAVPVLPLPDGGWVGEAVRVSRGRHLHRPARITPSGRIVPLRVAGEEMTPWSLHDALGRPASSRLPLPDPDFGSPDVPVRIVGYEEATRSLVVLYDEADARALARVPIAGGPPTLVEVVDTLAVDYLAW